jgi:hypothetical protein
MEDHLIPRRPLSEEKAEIAERISWANADISDPPLYVLVQERQEDEEAAMQRREENETPWEREESKQILRAEAEIAADTPIRRNRELMKTFSSAQAPQAATASV